METPGCALEPGLRAGIWPTPKADLGTTRVNCAWADCL